MIRDYVRVHFAGSVLINAHSTAHPAAYVFGLRPSRDADFPFLISVPFLRVADNPGVEQLRPTEFLAR
jgi:hypothetical protein